MLFEESLARDFDQLTSSMRFTIGPADVQVQRRRDGVLESLPRVTGTQKTAFMESVTRQVGCTTGDGIFELADGAVFGFIWVPALDERILVIRRVPDYRLRSLEEMGVEAGDAEQIRRMLRPPEGVIVVSCVWCGWLPPVAASVVAEGWAGTGETAACIGDFVRPRFPGAVRVRVDSTDRPSLARIVNTVRRSELLPVVIALANEEVALEEAFRLAQMDYRVYVICDSRSVTETFAWLRRRVDPWVLSEYLAGIISLREVTGLCPHCTEPDAAPDQELLRRVGLDASEVGRLRKGRGCPACQGSGMGPSQFAWEMLSQRDDETVSRLIQAGARAGEAELMEAVVRMRGLSLEDRARAMLRAGRTSLRDAEHDVFRMRFRT